MKAMPMALKEEVSHSGRDYH